jgi:hypothetical protein
MLLQEKSGNPVRRLGLVVDGLGLGYAFGLRVGPVEAAARPGANAMIFKTFSPN